MNNFEIEKSISHILIEIIEYVPNSIVTKTIIRNTTGNVTIVASDTNEDIVEKISPFDTFILVIEGAAEVIINSNSNILQVGQVIVIPQHTSHIIRANERFKMISTMIKNDNKESIV